MNPQTIQLAALLNGQGLNLEKGSAGKAEGQEGVGKGFLKFLAKAQGVEKNGYLPLWEAKKGGVSKSGWLESFKDMLLASGIGLEKISLSRNALDGLKKLLLGDGFSEKDVKDFLSSLFDNNVRKKINVSELLQRISELKGKREEKPDEILLDSSAVPHVETLLRSLGLDVRQAKNIIEQARVEGGKLNLKTLAKNLKNISQESVNTIEQEGRESSVDRIQGMLERIGIVEEDSKLSGPVSLERFVALIEKKVASLVPNHLSEGEVGKQVKGLLENVSVGAQENASKESRQDRRIKGQGFPFEGLAVGEKGTKKGLQEKLNEITSQAQKAVSESKESAEIRGWIDPKNISELQANKDDMSARMNRLVETLNNRPAEKTTAKNDAAAIHSTNDGTLGRLSNNVDMTKPEVRSIPLHVINQVGRRLGAAIKRGDNHLRLQLKPPHLGSIQLDLSMQDNTLKIAMVAEHQYVKDLIVSHVNELRDALVEQGVEIQKLDVEINQNFGQSMANADQDLKRARPGKGTFASGSKDDNMIVPDTGHQPVNNDGRLDMFA